MNRKANGIVVVLLLGVIIIGVFAFLGTRMIKTTPSTSGIVPTPNANIGDIDRSGAADETDRMMVRQHVGCLKEQPCWNSVVGKTKDGDNPLYVFDLDLNKDGSITQADIDLVK